MVSRSRVLLTSAVLLLGLTPGVFAGEEEESLDIEANGFLLGNFSGRTTGLRPGGDEGGDFLLAEERVRLDLGAWSESIEASARVRVDFLHDAVSDDFAIDLREGYADYTAGDFDFRLGRQIATWGVGDLLFINDVFPKDWISFFSGRPLEYLKLGVDGFRTRYSTNLINADLLVVPLFTPDSTVTSDRFFLFDPFDTVPVRDERRPAQTFSNTELALRLYRTIRGIEASLYLYRGFWGTPSMEPDSFAAPTQVTTFYPDLSVYGFSGRGSALGGVVSLEAGYYHSREDQNGKDPTVPNSQPRLLIGYQRQIWEDFTAGAQYYVEIMEDHSDYKRTLPAGLPVQKAYRDTVTLRLEQLLAHQTWRLSLLSFYSPVDRDYLVQPEVSYKFSDKLSAAVGANVFGGEKDTTFLGQLDRNDNVFVWVRFDF